MDRKGGGKGGRRGLDLYFLGLCMGSILVEEIAVREDLHEVGLAHVFNFRQKPMDGKESRSNIKHMVFVMSKSRIAWLLGEGGTLVVEVKNCKQKLHLEQ